MIQVFLIYLITSHRGLKFTQRLTSPSDLLEYQLTRQVYACTCIPTRFALPSSAEIRVQIAMKFIYSTRAYFYMGFELDLWLLFSLGVL